MRIALRRSDLSTPSRLGVCSIPLLPGQTLTAPQGVILQTVPVGFWPRHYLLQNRFTDIWKRHGWSPPASSEEKWPRRVLAWMYGGSPLDERLTLESGGQPGISPAVPQTDASKWDVQTQEQPVIWKRDESHWHYCADTGGAAEINFNHRVVRLRLGWQCANRRAWWQWVNAQRLWIGPVAQAWQIGGHIYAGPEDRRMTMAESEHPFDSPFAAEQMIAAQLYVVLLSNGSARCHAHFVNGELYGRGGFIEGTPLIEFDGLSGVDQCALDRSSMRPFGGDGELSAWREARMLLWQPFAGTKLILGKDMEIPDSERGFEPGSARTVHFNVNVAGAIPACRYLADPRQYFLSGELMVPLEPSNGKQSDARLIELSRTAAKVYLRNEMTSGFTAGGTFRYLDNYPEKRWEFSSDGNENASFFRGAYLLQNDELFNMALRNCDFNADLCCNHNNFTWRYHAGGGHREIFSLIYLRFAGLIHGYMETGDPYYLNIAQAGAARWIAQHQAHWPRRNMGRDAEPVEGLLLLHDFTGQDYYLDAARQIALQTVATLYSDGSWRSGAGAGPYWGANALDGSVWMGSHLLTGFSEFLARCPHDDPARPTVIQGARKMIGRWLDMIAAEGNFHRTSGAYAWRRHWSLVQAIGDPELSARMLKVLSVTLDRFIADGEAFFANGHHCAGYIDGPWYFMACGIN